LKETVSGGSSLKVTTIETGNVASPPSAGKLKFVITLPSTSSYTSPIIVASLIHSSEILIVAAVIGPRWTIFPLTSYSSSVEPNIERWQSSGVTPLVLFMSSANDSAKASIAER
jgi:hypothetical protein